MEKVKALWENKKLTWLFMAVGSVLIFLYYSKKIPYVYTVWELADEYGYLANAAYMSGTDWSFMVDFYYGYGYSILLVPLFWIFDSGLQIIRGAVFINVLCIVLIFWVSYILMRELFPKINDKLIGIAAFVMCFYPYFTGSGLKVLPECLVTLMIWVCGLVFYYALSTGKRGWYLLLAIVVNYTFFVHTRTFVFLGVVFLIGAVMFLQKKIDKKNLLYFISFAGILFILGTLWKNHIVDVVYSELVLKGATEKIGNTVSVSDIITKIQDLFTNFSVLHIDSLSAKLFYLFVATAGVFFIGIYVAVRDSILQIKKEKQIDTGNAIKIMYAIAALLMVVALVVNPMGESEGTAHYFYARYYEYLIGPVVLIGLCECMGRRVKFFVWLFIAGILYLVFWNTFDLIRYLEVPELYVDTNRMPALSHILLWDYLFGDVIKAGLMLTFEALLIIFVLNRFQWARWFIPIILFCMFYNNDKVNVEAVMLVNGNNKAQYEIAECVKKYEGLQEIYFLNGDKYDVIPYTGFQSLMGDRKITVIEKKDLDRVESGDMVITFIGNPYIEELEKKKTKLMEMGYYEVHAVE